MNGFSKLTAFSPTNYNKIDNGLIPTLNQMGYMTTFLDPYSEQFIEYSSVCKNPVLEIGSAYGIATLKALSVGATIVSNDLDARHLQILKRKCPASMQNRLTLIAGKFPHVTLPDNYFDAILTVRVLHFLDGRTLRKFLAKCYKLLTTNGKLFVVADTPYLKDWRDFTQIFEKRIRKNSKWPGIVSNTRLFKSKRIAQLPKLMHWMDQSVLHRELKLAGFNIESIEYLNRTDYPTDSRLDGRESIGAIAIKQQ